MIHYEIAAHGRLDLLVRDVQMKWKQKPSSLPVCLTHQLHFLSKQKNSVKKSEWVNQTFLLVLSRHQMNEWGIVWFHGHSECEEVFPPHRSAAVSSKWTSEHQRPWCHLSTCNHQPHLQVKTVNRQFPLEKKCFLKTWRPVRLNTHCKCVFVLSWNNTDPPQNIRCGMFSSDILQLSECMMGKRGPVAIYGHPGCLSPSWRLCRANLFWLGLNLVSGVVTQCVCVCALPSLSVENKHPCWLQHVTHCGETMKRNTHCVPKSSAGGWKCRSRPPSRKYEDALVERRREGHNDLNTMNQTISSTVRFTHRLSHFWTQLADDTQQLFDLWGK